jgi:DtxR family Mn-dependent transcriptional regulator
LDLNENAEEILEILWTKGEKEKKSRFSLKSIGIDKANNALKTLLKFNLVTLSDDHVSLTNMGQPKAESVVRRHRLAERLLVDVLDIEDKLVEEAACKFEHVIREGIEKNVCILLGHPRVCPHGNPIPIGSCCILGDDNTTSVVTPLSQLDSDQEGRIAYIHAKERKRLQKLMAMGITPGKSIQIIQRFPSYVFQIGQTQIAVDEEIANEIFVITS